MKAKKIARKVLWGALTTGATLALGFLSFSGMFILSSSLFWCGGAFILAAAYEGQVNGEGIAGALRRMFDKNYLKLGIARRFLDEQLQLRKKKKRVEELNLLEQLNKEQLIEHRNLQLELSKKNDIDENNAFLINYEKQKAYVDALEEIHDHSKKHKRKLAAARKRLRNMELFFLSQLENPQPHQPNSMESAVAKLLVNQRTALLTEMKHKAWLIRASWLFAIAGGISSGLATVSAMQVGLGVLGLSSVIPGGIVVTLSVFAAIGYSLLLYQAFSDMVQEYTGKWKDYFSKRDNESRATHVFRCIGTVLAIGLAIFATVATAGTWWYAAKNGAAILGVAEKAADALRSVAVSLMTVPTFIFATTNSVASIDNISNSNYKQLASDVMVDIKETWKKESFLRFINPFRFAEKIISYTAKTLLFLGHLISMGLISDHLDSVPPVASVALNASGEALEDLNYMPNEKHKHNHHSKILTALFLPVTIAVGILKFFAILWDRPFSGSFKKSYDKMFPSKGCDLFLMSSPTTPGNYKKSSPNHLYLYKKDNGKIFYILENEKKEHTVSISNDLKSKLTFNQSEKNPIKSDNPNVNTAILRITSGRGHTQEPKHAHAEKPQLSKDWHKQEVIQTCDKTIERLKTKSPAKAAAVDDIKKLVRNNETEAKTFEAASQALAINRNSLWHQPKTRSQKEMDTALNKYFIKVRLAN